jgi:hypothetical protein
LALFGHFTMSDLSPQSDPKQTLLDRSHLSRFYEYTPLALFMRFAVFLVYRIPFHLDKIRSKSTCFDVFSLSQSQFRGGMD